MKTVKECDAGSIRLLVDLHEGAVCLTMRATVEGVAYRGYLSYVAGASELTVSRYAKGEKPWTVFSVLSLEASYTNAQDHLKAAIEAAHDLA